VVIAHQPLPIGGTRRRLVTRGHVDVMCCGEDAFFRCQWSALSATSIPGDLPAPKPSSSVLSKIDVADGFDDEHALCGPRSKRVRRQKAMQVCDLAFFYGWSGYALVLIDQSAEYSVAPDRASGEITRRPSFCTEPQQFSNEGSWFRSCAQNVQIKIAVRPLLESSSSS